MATKYLEITALQSPISIGVDENNRAMLSFNVLCLHSGSPGTFEEDICKIIQNAGLATVGTNMWYSPTVQLPTTPGPFVTVESTGGFSPRQTHNNDKFSRPSAHIVVRAGDLGGAAGYTTARNKANAIHAALDGQHNVTV